MSIALASRECANASAAARERVARQRQRALLSLLDEVLDEFECAQIAGIDRVPPDHLAHARRIVTEAIGRPAVLEPEPAAAIETTFRAQSAVLRRLCPAYHSADELEDELAFR